MPKETVNVIKQQPLVEAVSVTKSDQRVSICRCGHSAQWPWCDGAHNSVAANDNAPAGREQLGPLIITIE